jgi:cell division protein FtsB
MIRRSHFSFARGSTGVIFVSQAGPPPVSTPPTHGAPAPPPRVKRPRSPPHLAPQSTILPKPSFLQRALLVLLPALVITSLAASAIWGESGLLARHQLREQLALENAGLAEVERANQRLVRDLRLMERDPLLLERMVAEELSWGREGDTLYRFED